ncbi:glycosyltransferase family 1 protein [Haloplanus rallus]|uniref:Glycosyltransferase family 1 protein n=1 Tax=Haloplanus rallus TaxID=1816183 RepID=A0A6B9F5X5_9EURY|nr:glycosyltransferase family 1 protein [Haloplanus rallus]QGX94812.1 glycosyltransferase family 1 protein [Haloplanus rallus]
MKIGINGLAAKSGGGVIYLQNLVTNILEISGHRLHFFIPSQISSRFNLPVDKDQLTVESVDVSGTVGRLWYEQTSIPRRIVQENIDLLYSPSEIPVFGCPCKQVVANQNSNLYYNIKIKKPLRQQVREMMLARALKISQSFSEATIFVSESSKRKAVRELDLSEDDTYSIHHGVDSAFRDASTEVVSGQLEEREYILLVSTVYKHKNIHNLVAAYSQLSPELRREHPLIIVGCKTVEQDYTQTVKSLLRDLGITEHVSLVGRATVPEVKAYYNNAHLFVFPSLTESFGLPMLEAMAAEVPVVASASAALPEIGGDAALYFDPNDPDQMSVIIKQVLNDPGLRKDLVDRGRKRAQMFTWKKCARETLDLFQEATGSKQSSE